MDNSDDGSGTTHPTQVSRRSALRAGLTGAAALAASAWSGRARAQDGTADDNPYDSGGRIPVHYDETVSFAEQFAFPPLMGRSEAWRLRVLEDPEKPTAVVRQVNYDEVVPIYRAFHATPPRGYDHNDVWFELDDGVIHSSWVVPVREEFHEPEDTIGNGFWGEITVPTSWQHWEPKLVSRRYYDMAHGAVFKVIDRYDEEDGRPWYRILNDLDHRHQWWIQARHVRRIDSREFWAISPDVPPDQKYVYVSIGQQTLTCYEYEVPVFATRIASGTTFFDAEGQPRSFRTPYGTHKVGRKTPSRHMVGGEVINDRYDLPGVPWCTFFTASGAAIHGTYWHNDYGHPRSHGCVNVTNDAAKWIYRWVNPYASPHHYWHVTDEDDYEQATRIIVEY